jgi:methionyl aminopeptidase
MSIESRADLLGMRHVGSIVARTITAMRVSARIGMTTAQLDAVAMGMFKNLGARSAPQLEYGFPGTTCISVNDEIVHGVPGDRVIRAGDVVKIDVTAEADGYVADAATTLLMPPHQAVTKRLKQSALEALRLGLLAARSGAKVSMIGKAVEAQARRDGFAIARELSGHGVGRRIHEAPSVPNYYQPFSRERLTEGLVLAIEPMLLSAASRIEEAADGWTIRAVNAAWAVHEEHTVIVGTSGVQILTAA